MLPEAGEPPRSTLRQAQGDGVCDPIVMARKSRSLTAPAAPEAPLVTLPEDCVLMGIFGAAVGLKGEVRIKSYTQDPVDIAAYGPLTGQDGRAYEITDLREAGEVVVARIKGVTDRTAAERLTNLKLYVAREILGETEDEDEFFHADLIGLRAELENGTLIGTVAALHDFGAGEVVEIRTTGGRSVDYPFTKAVVPVVDLAGGRIVIAPPAEVMGDER